MNLVHRHLRNKDYVGKIFEMPVAGKKFSVHYLCGCIDNCISSRKTVFLANLCCCYRNIFTKWPDPTLFREGNNLIGPRFTYFTSQKFGKFKLNYSRYQPVYSVGYMWAQCLFCRRVNQPLDPGRSIYQNRYLGSVQRLVRSERSR